MTTRRRSLILLSHHTLALAAVGVVAASVLVGPVERPSARDALTDDETVVADDEMVVTDDETVVAAPVEAQVRRVPLMAQAAQRTDAAASPAEEVAVSPAEPVVGYGTVGVTWDGDGVDEGEIRVEVRTEVDGEWSAWQEVEHHPEHGPDAASPEGRSSTVRAGTEPVVVGDVDHVQVRATTDDGEAEGIALEIVDPGQQQVTVQPELVLSAQTAQAAQTAAAPKKKPKLRPRIRTRAEWGADEKLRDKKSLTYGGARMGFVHHTVNANNYSKADVPAIIRGIYAYHTGSRGWSDIGYNFLVDRFGDLWEGRYGGMHRSVVGAHTSGYNSRSFSISAIGSFEAKRPSAAMVRSIGSLMGWKLGVHEIDPRRKSVLVRTGERFAPVSGHRDAGATACPGRHLYAELPYVARRAAWLQKRAGLFR